eukprot:9015759-Alexandrium_andersonii.AAC.1
MAVLAAAGAVPKVINQALELRERFASPWDQGRARPITAPAFVRKLATRAFCALEMAGIRKA